MNIEQLKANWTQFQGAVRERWGKLTDDEVTEIHGEFDQLVGKIQERYGIAREEAREQVNNWLRDMREPTQ